MAGEPIVIKSEIIVMVNPQTNNQTIWIVKTIKSGT